MADTSACKCVVCQKHRRPQYVPWDQHAIGCSVRAVALERSYLERRRSARADDL